MIVDKDRHGHLGGSGGIVAAVTGDFHDGRLVLRVTTPAGPPAEAAGTVENRVWAVVSTNPGCRTRDIAPAGVSRTQAHKALKRLIDKGDIIRKPEGRGYGHYLPDDDHEPALLEAQ